MTGHATEGPIPSARLTQGLVIAMQQYSRKHVIDLLNHLGVHPVAGEASRALPDPVDADQVAYPRMGTLGQDCLMPDPVISSPGGASADVGWPAQPDTAGSTARPAGKTVRIGEHRVRADRFGGRAWRPREMVLDRLLHADVIYVEGGNHYPRAQHHPPAVAWPTAS